MHVLDLNSFYSDLGGGVRTYTRRKREFFASRRDLRYTLIAAGAENRVEDVDANLRIYHVRGLLLSRVNQYRQLWDLPEIARILRMERPDVVEVGSPYLDPWLTFGAKAGLGTGFSPPCPSLRMPEMKLVGFYHSDFPDTYMAPFSAEWPEFLRRPFMAFWRRYVNFAYGRFDATLTPSFWIHEKLRKQGLSNTHPTPLGVDAELFHPAKRDPAFRASLGVGPWEPLMMYAGRFYKEKGLETLVDALPAVLAARPDAKMLFVGRGYLQPIVQRLAARYPERVRVLDFMENPEDLARAYASADLFFAPGPYETFGLAAVEAMASGLPVIAPTEGGGAETVSRANAGLLFHPHDAVDLAVKTHTLLRSDLATLGRKARSFAESRMTWNDTFQRQVDVYEGLLSQSCRPSVDDSSFVPDPDLLDAWRRVRADTRGNAVFPAPPLAPRVPTVPAATEADRGHSISAFVARRDPGEDGAGSASRDLGDAPRGISAGAVGGSALPRPMGLVGASGR